MMINKYPNKIKIIDPKLEKEVVNLRLQGMGALSISKILSDRTGIRISPTSVRTVLAEQHDADPAIQDKFKRINEQLTYVEGEAMEAIKILKERGDYGKLVAYLGLLIQQINTAARLLGDVNDKIKVQVNVLDMSTKIGEALEYYRDHKRLVCNDCKSTNVVIRSAA